MESVSPAIRHRMGIAPRVSAAIAIAAILLGVGAFQLLFRRVPSDFERLADTTARTHVRPIEARLSRFPYGRYVSLKRPSPGSKGQRNVRGVAASIVAASDTRNGAHVSAVAHLLAGQSRLAVDLLEQVVRSHPSNAAAWSDLSAARYELANGDDDIQVSFQRLPRRTAHCVCSQHLRRLRSTRRWRGMRRMKSTAPNALTHISSYFQHHRNGHRKRGNG